MVLHVRLPSSLKKLSTTNKNNHNNNDNTSPRITAGLTANTLIGTARTPSQEAAVAFETVAAGEELSTAAGAVWTSSVEEFAAGSGVGVCGSGDGDDGGGGGDCDQEGGETGLPAVDAWMMILRALSLGARSQERAVARHALQLLTKVSLGGVCSYWQQIDDRGFITMLSMSSVSPCFCIRVYMTVLSKVYVTQSLCVSASSNACVALQGFTCLLLPRTAVPDSPAP